MAYRPTGEQLDGRAADDLHTVVLAAVEHHLREDREIGGGAEETRVSSHAAQGVGVFVVNFAAKRVTSRRRDVGGRDTVAEGICRPVERVVHPQRSEHAPFQKFVEWLTRNDFDQEPEKIGAEIGVDVPAARTGLERAADYCRTRLEWTPGDAPDVPTRRQSGSVGEQLANGDLILLSTAERGQIVHDALVEVDLLLIEENHDRGRRADNLGERSDVVYRLLRVHGGAGGDPGEPAESPLHHGCSVPSHDDSRARVTPCLDAAGYHALDCLETGGGHADVRGGLDGQSVAGTGDCECGENDPEQR